MPVSAPLRQAPLVHLSTDFIRAKEYLEAIVSSSGDAICTTDVRGRVIYFSPGAEALFTAASAEVVGRPVHTLYSGGRPEAERIQRALDKDGVLRGYETVIRAKDGRKVHVSLSASLLRDRDGRVIGTLGISKDITARVELERRLKELSITDTLTGLYNQRHLREQLGHEIARARRQRQRLSLILIDLDGFKRVNDSKGHLEGDRLLKNFAALLSRGLRREVDAAFRYGGDEFVVLLPGQSEAKARVVAERLRRAAAAQGVRFSWGAAALPKSGGAAELVRLADRRMFAMKRRSSE